VDRRWPPVDAQYVRPAGQAELIAAVTRSPRFVRETLLLFPSETAWSELTFELSEVEDVHEAIAWAESKYRN
jgi:hypothetical protein